KRLPTASQSCPAPAPAAHTPKPTPPAHRQPPRRPPTPDAPPAPHRRLREPEPAPTPTPKNRPHPPTHHAIADGLKPHPDPPLAARRTPRHGPSSSVADSPKLTPHAP